jgi:hypothetical protein
MEPKEGNAALQRAAGPSQPLVLNSQIARNAIYSATGLNAILLRVAFRHA